MTVGSKLGDTAYRAFRRAADDYVRVQVAFSDLQRAYLESDNGRSDVDNLTRMMADARVKEAIGDTAFFAQRVQTFGLIYQVARERERELHGEVRE